MAHDNVRGLDDKFSMAFLLCIIILSMLTSTVRATSVTVPIQPSGYASATTHNVLTTGQQEAEACRLWAMMEGSDSPSQLQAVVIRHLLTDPYCIKKLGDTDGYPCHNPNGWGLCYYQADVSQPPIANLRGSGPAATNSAFDTDAGNVAANMKNVAIGHVRYSTNPYTSSFPDPHPFVNPCPGSGGCEYWMFAHNGAIDNKDLLIALIGGSQWKDWWSYVPVSSGMRSGGPLWPPPFQNPYWGVVNLDNRPQNWIDSELYFMFLMKCINEAGGDVLAGTTKALQTMYAVGLCDSNSLNFVLSNGEALWGFRRDCNDYHPLYYYVNSNSQGYRALASTPPPASSNEVNPPYPSSVSDPDGGKWKLLDDWQLIEISFVNGAFAITLNTISQSIPTNVRMVGTSGQTYSSITEAITAANPNDVICVKSGTYTEHVDLSQKAVTLVGYNGEDPAIVGGGDWAIIIEEDGVSVSGFKIAPVSPTIIGIYAYCPRPDRQFIIVTDCEIEKVMGTGISLVNLRWGILINNRIQGTSTSRIIQGIVLYAPVAVYEGDNFQVSENTIDYCGAGVAVEGGFSWVEFNRITNCDTKIWLEFYIEVVLYYNDLSNCGTAIRCDSGSGNSIIRNFIANSEYGIQLYNSSNNIIRDNTIVNNNVGIYLESSNNNHIYHNNFINNTAQVYTTSSTSIWDDGYPFGGNCWNNQIGPDSYRGPFQNVTGSDGIVDTPHTIDSNNTDHYPLMGPFSSFHGVSIVSNSSISDFQINEATVSFNVTGLLGTKGFCTLTIPHSILPSSYIVMVDDHLIPYTTIFENDTLSVIYFTYEHSTHEVTITGDASGDINHDGKVDIMDVAMVCAAFGSYPGLPKWNPACDINGDYKVDIKDVARVVARFGWHA
jgi:parallel beta-helix repeat protein